MSFLASKRAEPNKFMVSFSTYQIDLRIFVGGHPKTQPFTFCCQTKKRQQSGKRQSRRIKVWNGNEKSQTFSPFP